jgi:hypothetical protein
MIITESHPTPWTVSGSPSEPIIKDADGGSMTKNDFILGTLEKVAGCFNRISLEATPTQWQKFGIYINPVCSLVNISHELLEAPK